MNNLVNLFLPNTAINRSNFLKEKILYSLTPTQKKIGLIVLAIFTALSVCFYYRSIRFSFKAKDLSKSSHEDLSKSESEDLSRFHKELILKKERCESLLKKDSINVKTLVEYGSILMKLYDFKNAKVQFENALSIDPNHVEGLIGYGQSEVGCSRDFGKAKLCFEKALKLDPTNSDAFAYYGMTLCSLKQYNAVKDCLEKALELNPNNVCAWVFYAIYSKTKGASSAEVLSKLEQALKIDPYETEAMSFYAYCSSESEEFKINLYKKALLITPKCEPALQFYGEILLNRMKIHRNPEIAKEAEQIFRDLLSIHPDDAVISTKIAECLNCQGKIEEAEDQFKLALDMDPSNANVLFPYEHFLREQGREDEMHALHKQYHGDDHMRVQIR